MFYLNSTLNFGIPPDLLFQLEVYYIVDIPLTGLTAKQKGTTARWYSNKTSLLFSFLNLCSIVISTVYCSIVINVNKDKYMYGQL